MNLDIDGWLRGIGLEQYAQTFRDNAIDADVLCDLTDEHLRELGLPLGARLKLLRAVAALSTGHTPVSPEITTPAFQRKKPLVQGHEWSSRCRSIPNAFRSFQIRLSDSFSFGRRK
jgi:hypothetical protein